MKLEFRTRCYACNIILMTGNEVEAYHCYFGWIVLCSDCSGKCGNTVEDNPQQALRAILAYRTERYDEVDAVGVDLISRLLNVNMFDIMDWGKEQ